MEEAKSKSAAKRELHAIQDLGRQLVELPDKNLLNLALPDDLLTTIRAARTMSRGARQRQLRYLGGLLLHADIERIQTALARELNPGREERARFHALERCRDRLLDGDESTISAYLEENPNADRQQLRQLVRNAAKERIANKPPKSARQLFKYLRDLDG